MRPENKIYIVQAGLTFMCMPLCGQAVSDYNMTHATLSSYHHTCIYLLVEENNAIVLKNVVGW